MKMELPTIRGKGDDGSLDLLEQGNNKSKVNIPVKRKKQNETWKSINSVSKIRSQAKSELDSREENLTTPGATKLVTKRKPVKLRPQRRSPSHKIKWQGKVLKKHKQKIGSPKRRQRKGKQKVLLAPVESRPKRRKDHTYGDRETLFQELSRPRSRKVQRKRRMTVEIGKSMDRCSSQFSREVEELSRLQEIVRAKQRKRDEILMQQATRVAMMLQKLWRGRIGRVLTRYIYLSRNAIVIQRMVRRVLAQHHYFRYQCAIFLQKHWRGYLARKRASSIRQDFTDQMRNQAIVRIQSKGRGYLNRKRHLQKKAAVTKVQGIARGKLVRETAQKEEVQREAIKRKHSAIIIQKRVKKFIDGKPGPQRKPKRGGDRSKNKSNRQSNRESIGRSRKRENAKPASHKNKKQLGLPSDSKLQDGNKATKNATTQKKGDVSINEEAGSESEPVSTKKMSAVESRRATARAMAQSGQLFGFNQSNKQVDTNSSIKNNENDATEGQGKSSSISKTEQKKQSEKMLDTNGTAPNSHGNTTEPSRREKRHPKQPSGITNRRRSSESIKLIPEKGARDHQSQTAARRRNSKQLASATRKHSNSTSSSNVKQTKVSKEKSVQNEHGTQQKPEAPREAKTVKPSNVEASNLAKKIADGGENANGTTQSWKPEPDNALPSNKSTMVRGSNSEVSRQASITQNSIEKAEVAKARESQKSVSNPPDGEQNENYGIEFSAFAHSPLIEQTKVLRDQPHKAMSEPQDESEIEDAYEFDFEEGSGDEFKEENLKDMPYVDSIPQDYESRMVTDVCKLQKVDVMVSKATSSQEQVPNNPNGSPDDEEEGYISEEFEEDFESDVDVADTKQTKMDDMTKLSSLMSTTIDESKPNEDENINPKAISSNELKTRKDDTEKSFSASSTSPDKPNSKEDDLVYPSPKSSITTQNQESDDDLPLMPKSNCEETANQSGLDAGTFLQSISGSEALKTRNLASKEITSLLSKEEYQNVEQYEGQEFHESTFPDFDETSQGHDFRQKGPVEVHGSFHVTDSHQNGTEPISVPQVASNQGNGEERKLLETNSSVDDKLDVLFQAETITSGNPKESEFPSGDDSEDSSNDILSFLKPKPKKDQRSHQGGESSTFSSDPVPQDPDAVTSPSGLDDIPSLDEVARNPTTFRDSNHHNDTAENTRQAESSNADHLQVFKGGFQAQSLSLREPTTLMNQSDTIPPLDDHSQTHHLQNEPSCNTESDIDNTKNDREEQNTFVTGVETTTYSANIDSYDDDFDEALDVIEL